MMVIRKIFGWLVLLFGVSFIVAGFIALPYSLRDAGWIWGIGIVSVIGGWWVAHPVFKEAK